MSHPSLILLLEDSPHEALFLERLLTGHKGFPEAAIQICKSLEEARDFLGKHTPDIAVLDYQLPDGTAMDLMEEWGKDPKFPVMVLTAKGNESTAVAALKSGATDYLTKDGTGLSEFLPRLRICLKDWRERMLKAEMRSKLQDREQLLTDFLNESTDLIQIVSMQGKFLFTNDSWHRTLGYTREEIRHMGVLDLIPDEEKDHCINLLGQLAQGKGFSGILAKFKAKDGHLVHVRGDINVRIDEQGQPTSTRAFWRDVTIEQEITQRLQQERDLSQNYLNTIQTILVSLDVQGKIQMINRQGCLELGKDEKDLLGSDWFDHCVKNSTRTGHLRDEFLRHIQKQDKPSWQSEYGIQNEKGEVRLYAWRNVLLRGETGQVMGMICSGQDITEIRKAEADLRKFNQELESQFIAKSTALKETEERLGAIFTSSMDGFLIIDNKKILLRNPAMESMLLGSKAPRLFPFTEIDQLLNLVLLEEEKVRWIQNLTALEQGELEFFRQEIQFLRPDETIISLDVSATCFIVNKEINMMLAFRDISQRRQAEKQLQRMQRLDILGSLAGGIVHDLNNVLGPIIMTAEMLQLEGTLAPEQAEMMDFMIQSAKRGSEMLAHLLHFTKGGKARFEKMDLRSEIHSMEKLIRTSVTKRISLDLQVPMDLPLVRADASQVHQVLLNLCVNARDAMPKGGKLRIELKKVHFKTPPAKCVPSGRAGDYVLIEVQDAGTGIAPEHLEQIFDPFFTTKEMDKGTGLGLATVLQIIQRHQGFLSIESLVGQGTTFQIFLPQCEADEAIPESDRKSPPQPKAIRKVLLVEDQENIRRLLATQLKRHDFEVETAIDGVEGLEKMAALGSDLDLVISDLNMPRMDGVQLIEAVRAQGYTVPIMVTTAHLSPERQDRLRDMEVGAVLFKPYNMQELLKEIQMLFEGPADHGN